MHTIMHSVLSLFERDIERGRVAEFNMKNIPGETLERMIANAGEVVRGVLAVLPDFYRPPAVVSRHYWVKSPFYFNNFDYI